MRVIRKMHHSDLNYNEIHVSILETLEEYMYIRKKNMSLRICVIFLLIYDR